MPQYCRVCQSVVALSAEKCPQCGADQPSLGRFGYGLYTVIMWAVVLVGGVVVLGWLLL